MEPLNLETIDQCPPFVIYYLSHHGRGRRVPLKELVRDSGLSERTFTRTIKLLSWSTVKVGVMERYCRACGLSPFQPDYVLGLLQKEFESGQPMEIFAPKCRARMLAVFNNLCARAAAHKRDGNKAL